MSQAPESPAEPPEGHSHAGHPPGQGHAQPHHAGHGHRHHPHAGHPRKPGRKWILWVVIGAGVLLIGGCLLLRHPAATKNKNPQNGGVIPVSATAVRQGNIDVTLDALGIVTPVYTVTVTSRVSGAVAEVLYREGQTVKKGDLLIQIDPVPYQAAVTQAQGQLERDQALLEDARIDLVRYQNAVRVHAIPEQQLATQQAQVKEDEGTVKVDQGNLQAAQANLDYASIRAPIDGKLGLRLVDPGNIVTANGTTALVVITQIRPITVIFTVAEDYLGEIIPEMKPGQPLRVDALDRMQQKKVAQGQLETIDNQIATATGTVRARAVFANLQNELFPNQFVNARLYIKTLTGVDLIPAAAIQRNDTTAFVYVIQPDTTVKSENVTVTVTEGDTAAVTGVQPGQQLVTDGFEKLQDGSKVRVRQPGAPSPPSSANQKPKESGKKSGGA